MRALAPCAATASRAFAVVILALLAGCAAPLRSTIETSAVAVPDASFEVAGRLSARHGREAAAVNFRWQHSPVTDELVLTSPLGQTLARLRGDATRARLELPDGRVREAGDFEQLTATVLHAPVPVRGLAWWIRGAPLPAQPFTLERDAAGRILVLRQQGWEIVYDYGDDARPTRLHMTFPDTQIRLAVDDWIAAPASPTPAR